MSSSKLLLQSKLSLCFKLKCAKSQVQCFSTAIAAKDQSINKMKAWQIHSYGGLEELQFTESARLPVINDANRLLIKVTAAGVNPIDVAVANGYGAVLLNKLRQAEALSCDPIVEFPLILGRDFSGEVVAKGENVGSEFNIGDKVFGVTQPHESGCHAEFVNAHKFLVHKLPENISDVEASSILYTGLTAWSALKVTGDLALIPAKNKQVLVLGGSGGVGTIAIQLLKAWGAKVVATCSTDAVPLVESLNADCVVDYSSNDHFSILNSIGKYDIILDAAGLSENEVANYTPLLKEWALAKFITLKSPLLRNIDESGVVGGMLLNGINLISNNLPNLFRGSTVRWGFFMPLNQGVKEIAHLISEEKIKPIIHKEFNFSGLCEAYRTVQNGHLRGKVVLNFTSNSCEEKLGT